MKTLKPLILTVRIAEDDLEPFDQLRRQHFPSNRNFLRAHLTIFHRLPGEHVERLVAIIKGCAAEDEAFAANVAGVRHLGAGVAYAIESNQLTRVQLKLRSAFLHWLGGQDMQKWQPHITVQNKVDRSVADKLHDKLSRNFELRSIMVEGMDLWRYLDGPWQLEKTVMFG